MADLTKRTVGVVMAGMAAATPALSQTQTENIVSEQRTSVSLRISPEAAQAFMPEGWVPNAPNLSLIFMDRKLQLTPDGKPLQSGANRVLVLSMAGKNKATGEVKGLIVGGYSTDPAGVPGAYKVYKPGAVTVTRTERDEVKDGKLESRVEEHWVARGADGASVTLDLAFTRGLPTLTTLDAKVYSGAEPDFYRNYRGQQATDVLRNASGVNRVQSVSLKASGGALGKAIDGTEQIVSISNAPFYTRLTFVP
jgi:hypothetical protein